MLDDMNIANDENINWLLEGDVSIQYQVYRDLLSERVLKHFSST